MLAKTGTLLFCGWLALFLAVSPGAFAQTTPRQPAATPESSPRFSPQAPRPPETPGIRNPGVEDDAGVLIGALDRPCLRARQSVKLQGRNLLSPQAPNWRSLELRGHGVKQPVTLLSITDKAIEFSLPEGTSLEPGRFYRLQVRQAGGTPQVIVPAVAICKAVQVHVEADRPVILAAIRIRGGAELAPLYPRSLDDFRRGMAAAGMTILEERLLDGLGMYTARIASPSGVDPATALAQLRRDFPEVAFDLDTVFAAAGEPLRYADAMIGLAGNCISSLPDIHFGLLDTAVSLAQPDLQPDLQGERLEITQWAPGDLSGVKGDDHGTAIAALLAVGQSRLHLSIAAVMETEDRQSRTTADRILQGIDWMSGQGVELALLALEGNTNEVLDLALLSAADRGMAMIGAAGNGGPESPVTFPASSRWVFAVTAVDASGAVYRQASRGREVLASAPGVEIWAPSASGSGRYYSGTSFAVPLAALALAPMMDRIPQSERAGLKALKFRGDINRQIANSARDLGPAGRDPIYGWGLLQVPCGNIKDSRAPSVHRA